MNPGLPDSKDQMLFLQTTHCLKKWTIEFCCTSSLHTNTGGITSIFIYIKTKRKRPPLNKSCGFTKAIPFKGGNLKIYAVTFLIWIFSLGTLTYNIMGEQEVCILPCSLNILLYYYYKLSSTLYTSGVETFKLEAYRPWILNFKKKECK